MSNDALFKEFTQLALRTESVVDEASINVEAFKALLDVFITAGTLLDFMKKGIFYGDYTKYDTHFVEIVGALNDRVLQYIIAERNEIREPVTDLNFRIVHGLLGTITESSEIAEILRKYLDTKSVDSVNVCEEYSDSDWYKAITFNELQLDEQIGRANVINKLRVRFPDKFSAENAASRDLKAEREQLELNL
jgi:hypothetical protein